MFDLKSIIFLFLFLLSLISTNNNVYRCKPNDTEKKIEIGNDVTLCIHAVNLARKVVFKIKVDDYSVISINDGFSNIVNSINSETEKETNVRRLDNRNLLKENDLQVNGSSSNETSNESSYSSEEISHILSNEITTQQPSNIPYIETSYIVTNIIPTNTPTTNIQADETQSDNSSDDITEEIKEEFIGQIGNVRTKFPTVS